MKRERRGVIERASWFALQHEPCVFVAEYLISGVDAVACRCKVSMGSIARRRLDSVPRLRLTFPAIHLSANLPFLVPYASYHYRVPNMLYATLTSTTAYDDKDAYVSYRLLIDAEAKLYNAFWYPFPNILLVTHSRQVSPVSPPSSQRRPMQSFLPVWSSNAIFDPLKNGNVMQRHQCARYNFC